MKTLRRLEDIQVFDAATLDMKPEISREGFLRAIADVTRAGIFIYADEKGRPVRMLRNDDEVFSPASMATLPGKPITRTHPPILLDAMSAKNAMVGATGDQAVQVEKRLRIPVSIFDAPTIQGIRAGKVEVSCGYLADVVMEPGVHPEYGPYDGQQGNIRYNHLAVDIDEGRAGSEVRILMDSSGFIPTEESDVKKTPQQLKDEAEAQAKKGEQVPFKIGDTEFQVTPALAEAIGNHLTGMEEQAKAAHDEFAGKLAELGKAKEDAEGDLAKAAEATEGQGAQDEDEEKGKAAEAKMDSLKPVTAAGKKLKDGLLRVTGALKGLRTELKTKMDSAGPENIRKAAQEQAKLVAVVCALDSKAVAGELFAKPAAELKKLAIVARDPKAVLDGKDAAYIDGRFDAVASTVKVNLGKVLGEAMLDNAEAAAKADEKPAERKKWTPEPLTSHKA